MIFLFFRHITSKSASTLDYYIGVLGKLMILQGQSLVTIYKSFISYHLDYGNIIFDQACNKSFHDNLE